MDVLETRLEANKLHNDSNLSELYKTYEERVLVDEKIKELKKHIKQTTCILHMDELKCRKRVLRR